MDALTEAVRGGGEMTYLELYEKANRMLDNNEITLGEYEEMIKPLEAEAERWIPCSELMPKQGQEVICQCRASIIKVLKLNAHGDWYQDAKHCYMRGFVIAWMPLPKPYEEEKE